MESICISLPVVEILTPKNKNILIEAGVYWWNAEANYAFNLGKALREQGHRVWFCVEQNSLIAERLKEEKFQFLEFKRHRFFSVFLLLRQFILEKKIDTVIGCISRLHPVFAVLRYFSQIQFRFIRVRGSATPPSSGFMNSFLYGKNCTDVLVCANRSICRSFQNLREKEASTVMIPFGSPGFSADCSESPEKILKTYGFPPDARIFCLLGRNQRVKGHLELLEALRSLKIPDRVYFLFLIKDLQEFPEELQQIQKLARSIDPEKIQIRGKLERPGNLMSLCQFGLIPSQGSEAICRIAVEWMSLSIPVLATPVGGMPEIITSGKNGYLFENTSSEAIRKGLEYCFSMKETEQEKWKNCALSDYQKFYSQTAFADQFNKLV